MSISSYTSLHQQDDEEAPPNNREMYMPMSTTSDHAHASGRSSPTMPFSRPPIFEKVLKVRDRLCWICAELEMLGIMIMLTLVVVLALTQGPVKAFKKAVSHVAENVFLFGFAIIALGLFKRLLVNHIRNEIKKEGKEMLNHVQQLPHVIEGKLIEVLKEPLGVLNGLEGKVCGAVHAAEERLCEGVKEVPLELKKALYDLKQEIEAHFQQAAEKVEQVKTKVHEVHEHVKEKRAARREKIKDFLGVDKT